MSLLAIAKAQVQNAADLTALTAARTLNGNSANNYNQTAATTNANNVLTYNTILGHNINSSQLSMSFGSYDYNETTSTFAANFPVTTGSPTTAVSATITCSAVPGLFSRIWGTQLLPTVAATAQAVHRPRDIALTLDLSGSMRMGTALGFDFNSSQRTTNNNDSLVPTFGHYSSTGAVMEGPATARTSAYQNYTIPPSNSTATTTSTAFTYINTLLQNAAYASTLVRAYDSYTSTDGGATWTAPTSATPQLPPPSYASVPGGDVPVSVWWSNTTYTSDVKDIVGTTSRYAAWELDGYSNCTNGDWTAAANGQSNYKNAPFHGYTQGPGYYGKTFFIWPPDPRRPLSTGTATAWSTAAKDTATIVQFLADFGYAASDFGNTAFTTTLAAAITSTTATSVTVASKSSFPTTANYFIVIDNEVMKVTAGANTTSWTVARGVNSTVAATHSSGKAVGLWSGPPLTGLYTAASTGTVPNKTPPTSQTWPWPNDGGATLKTYLTTYVYTPSSAGNPPHLLATTDAAYQQIMRLYNWNYVIDNLGTTPCDWRIRFFGTNNNAVLFQPSGNIGDLALPGSGTYTINYSEILRWLTQSPNPFPTQLRAGRIKYYGSIPTAITGTWPNYGGTDQRFWVECIDNMLGFAQTSAGVYTDISTMVGYGIDFAWQTTNVSAPPSNTQYMNYLDNPQRPLLRCWFSPMLQADYLHNYNMATVAPTYDFTYRYKQSGNSYESPIYAAKQSYLAAITTMQNNHPNDWFTIVPYSSPRVSASDTAGRLNVVRSPLGTNYSYASSALLFPFSTINANGSNNVGELTPYTPDSSTAMDPCADFVDIPRADGDTCFAMALMMCYNQFAATSPGDSTLRSYVTTSPIPFPSNMAGGNGRKGAQKVVIFETDGMPNCSANANLNSAGTYNYYAIRYDMNKPSSSEYPTISELWINDSTVLSQIYSLVQNLASTYGTARNPFRLYTVGFGPLFQGVNASAAQSTLQTMQYYAGTQSSISTPLASNQIITGTDAQMSANMIQTFTQILENGAQIALIK